MYFVILGNINVCPTSIRSFDYCKYTQIKGEKVKIRGLGQLHMEYIC